MIELILVGNRAKIDEVSFDRSALNRADAKANLVVSGGTRVDDVLRLLPTSRVLRRQRDEFGLVDFRNRQERALPRQRVIEITAVARSIFFEGSNTEFGFMFVLDALLRLTRFEEFLSELMTPLEVAGVGSADFLVRMLFNLATLGPGWSLG
jgi:hypothetical protein